MCAMYGGCAEGTVEEARSEVEVETLATKWTPLRACSCRSTKALQANLRSRYLQMLVQERVIHPSDTVFAICTDLCYPNLSIMIKLK